MIGWTKKTIKIITDMQEHMNNVQLSATIVYKDGWVYYEQDIEIALECKIFMWLYNKRSTILLWYRFEFAWAQPLLTHQGQCLIMAFRALTKLQQPVTPSSAA